MARTTDAPAKPRSDAYTGILFISLLALIGACVLLYLDYSQYESRTPTKAPAIELPKGGGGTGTTPKGAPPKVDPMTKAPVDKAVETTAIRPTIETPPAAPAAIPMLELPGLAPVPVITASDLGVLPAKFERVEPVAAKPMQPLVAIPEREPVKAISGKPIFIEEPKPMPAKVPAISAPTLDEPPPVIRPFVPSK